MPGYQGPARVTLLVIDPYLVHAYWDLDPAPLAEASPAVLRVYDTTGGASSYFDVPVSLASKNWYLNLWMPERSYCAELGLSREGGGFTPLARSNAIQTPRAWPVAAPAPASIPVETQEAATQASVPSAEPVLEPLSEPRERAPVPLPLVAAQQPDSVLPSCDRQEAVPDNAEIHLVAEMAEPVPSPPRIPEPVDAARLLRTRLEEIYALLEWKSPAVEAAKLPAPDVPSPPPVATNRARPRDLTQDAEEHFSTGVSSKPPKLPA